MRVFGKRMGILTGLLVFLCLSCAGCGRKMTEDKLAERLKEAVEGKSITKMHMEMDMEASWNVSLPGADMSVDMKADTDMLMLLDREPLRAYEDVKMHLEVMGQKEDMHAEGYMRVEDDTMVLYMQDSSDSRWTRTEAMDNMESWMGFFESREMLSNLTGETELEEETTEAEGREAYVLHTKEEIDSGMFFQGFGTAMPDVSDQMEGLMKNLKKVEVPMTLYVDKKTYLPLKMEMDGTGLEEMMNDALAEVMEEAVGALKDVVGTEISLTISLDRMDIVMSGFSFDPQEIPDVPQEALEALESGRMEEKETAEEDILEETIFRQVLQNPDTDTSEEDRGCILRLSDCAVKITPPKGMTPGEQTDEVVTFMDDSGDNLIVYALVSKEEGEAQAESLESEYREIFEAVGIEVRSGKHEVVSNFGNLDGYWLSGEGISICYVCVPLKDHCLFVERMNAGDGWLDTGEALAEVLAYAEELAEKTARGA